MDWMSNCRNRLPEHLDGNGDLAPPWEQFPAYERYTLGWRMGTGEDWLNLWHVFLEDFDPAFEARLAYLRRHAPAPETWAETVHHVLHPSQTDPERFDDDEGAVAERALDFRRAGLIASDIAYPNWLSRQQALIWPWECAESPEDMARHWTRDFWFWSRRVAALTADPGWEMPVVPDRWQACAEPLRTREVRSPDPRRGLLTLARMLSAGRVIPPWQLGLTLDDFADSFEEDMGYVDAFRLWGMSSFDDRNQFETYMTATSAPDVWSVWATRQFLLFD